MIELPETPAPNAASPALLDFGFLQRPSTGAGALRVDRPGSRWRLEVSYPVMRADTARVFNSRLIAAKREGLKLTFPLLGVSQGSPGSPTVDGSSASGTSLPVKGLTPGYVVKEGYWLNAIDADGVRYLYNVRATVAADSSGDATLTVEPMIRAPLADGDEIVLDKPMIEGFVDSDWSWPMGLADLVEGFSFTMEEVA